MSDFFYNLPASTLGLYLLSIGVMAVIVGIVIIKPIFRIIMGTGPDFNYLVNVTTSAFTLFYALLLGLLTVAAYQNSERIKEGILVEATSLGVLYADMNSYPEPIRSDLKSMMRDYVLFTIYRDWPAHKKGEILNGGFNRADAMRRGLSRFEPQTTREEIIHSQAMASLQEFASSRQRRLAGVTTEIPNVLWYAVMIGAFITVLLVVVLKMRLVQQFVLGSITAMFLGVILFVIISLDRPLRGNSGLNPDPWHNLWERSMVWDEPLN